MSLFLLIVSLFNLSYGSIGFGAVQVGNTIVFAWDTYEDAANTVGFHLYQSNTPGSYSFVPTATFQGGYTTTGSIPKPKPGIYYWTMTAYTMDTESGYSNEVSLVILPQPPKGLTVTIAP